jgi:excisionase family DNA binding protein
VESTETTETSFVAPPLLKLEEAARLARVSRSHIWKRIQRGEIPAVRVGNTTGPIRVPTEAFLAWLYEQAPEEQASIQPSDLQPWVDIGGWVEEPS